MQQKSFYAHNRHAGNTYGTVTLAAGTTESGWQTLSAEKHPANVTPTVILTPIGEIANVNTYTYEITLTNNGVWTWKAACSHNGHPDDAGTGRSGININYQVISMWT